jgi:hypothetical protein
MKTLVFNLLIVVAITIGVTGLAEAQKPDRAMGPNVAQSELTSFTTPSNTFRIYAGETRSHWVYLSAGSNANVELYGDGDTDLDLYVYDGNGNLISSRTGSADSEMTRLEIFQSGYFCVKVVNRGSVYNDYKLFVTSY